ncbi:MAG: hypothetical protein JXR62_02360, partial [Bacilli bacterium]|nr:hypothetical protein [Bacilli bacterium]
MSKIKGPLNDTTTVVSPVSDYRHAKGKAVMDNVRDAELNYKKDAYSGHSNIGFEKQDLFTRFKNFIIYATVAGFV